MSFVDHGVFVGPSRDRPGELFLEVRERVQQLPRGAALELAAAIVGVFPDAAEGLAGLVIAAEHRAAEAEKELARATVELNRLTREVHRRG